MTILFTILHIIVSLFLILIVLAQQGKGQDLASAFGGGGSQTAFGARSTATLLSKITAVTAITFMLTSLTLGYLRPVISGGTVVPETAPSAAPAEASPGGGQPATGTEDHSGHSHAVGEGSKDVAPVESKPEASESHSHPH